MSFSEFGNKRTEESFGNLEAKHIDDLNASSQNVKLGLNQSILGQDRNTTISFVTLAENSRCVIPKGSIIHSVEVVAHQKVAEDLSIALGYFCDIVVSDAGKKSIFSRISGQENPLLGSMLNRHGRVVFDQKLNNVAVANQDTLYNAERKSQNKQVGAVVDYSAMGGACFGEGEDLYPAITVLNGSLEKNAITINICFSK